MTPILGNVLTNDKFCKWFTVEGLPGAGRKEFAEKFCEATGVKNWGAGHLLWELERLKVGCPRDLFADNLFLGIRLGQAPPGVERDVRAGHALLEDARRWYFLIFQILLFY